MDVFGTQYPLFDNTSKFKAFHYTVLVYVYS